MLHVRHRIGYPRSQRSETLFDHHLPRSRWPCRPHTGHGTAAPRSASTIRVSGPVHLEDVALRLQRRSESPTLIWILPSSTLRVIAACSTPALSVVRPAQVLVGGPSHDARGQLPLRQRPQSRCTEIEANSALAVARLVTLERADDDQIFGRGETRRIAGWSRCALSFDLEPAERLPGRSELLQVASTTRRIDFSSKVVNSLVRQVRIGKRPLPPNRLSTIVTTSGASTISTIQRACAAASC